MVAARRRGESAGAAAVALLPAPPSPALGLAWHVSEPILQVYGADAGEHARTAIGVATVPFNAPLVVSAEVEVRA